MQSPSTANKTNFSSSSSSSSESSSSDSQNEAIPKSGSPKLNKGGPPDLAEKRSKYNKQKKKGKLE